MRLENKYFPVFMGALAALSIAVIIYASFSFKGKSEKRFLKNIADYDSLTVQPMRLVLQDDSLAVASVEDKNVILLFFSSWSEKSQLMLAELDELTARKPSVRVIGALVNDATDTIDFDTLPARFFYVDGVKMFNELKVPGIPAYIVFDKEKAYKFAHVGYQLGAGTSLIEKYLDE